MDKPDEFIIATGQTHPLKDFIKYVFEYLNLDYKKYIKEDISLLKRQNKGIYCGDYSKLKFQTGWEPTINLKELAKIMVQSEKKENFIN